MCVCVIYIYIYSPLITHKYQIHPQKPGFVVGSIDVGSLKPLFCGI